jgi:hypothetical protein
VTIGGDLTVRRVGYGARQLTGPEYTDLGAVGNRLYLRQSAYMSMHRLGLDRIQL